MHKPTEPDPTVIERRETPAEQPLPGWPPVDLLTESSPWQDPTVSKIRIVGIGVAGWPQGVTLADLLEYEPAAGRSVALCEVGRCR